MKDICPNLHNKQVAQEYGELEDLFGPDTAHLLWSRNNGYSIDKAPNGADSILFGELLHITNGDRTQALILKAKVYSDEFFKWFGNWVNAAKGNPYSKDISIGPPEADFSNVDSTGTGVLIPIFLNGEYIGETGLDNALYHKDKGMSIKGKYMEMPSVGGSNITIEKEYRGKGYGKATYFELAKLAANNGKILRSAPDKSRTPASTRVWESLVRDGYAKRVNDRYEIINSTLNNASKVVDENGEPLVVYHGSKSKDKISIFNEYYEKGTFFSTSRNVGSVYATNEDNLYSVFINSKNPLMIDNKGKDWNKINAEDLIEAAEKMFGISKEEFLESLGEDRIVTTDGIIAAISRLAEEENSPYDGLILKNVIETEDNEIATDVVTIKSNQIKSATDNIGTFDSNNPDIRYREASITPEAIQKYHQEKLDYSNLDNTQKVLLEDRGISEEQYSFLTQAEKENLRMCLI